MSPPTKKKLPAERQLDREQIGNYMAAAADEKTTAILAATYDNADDYWRSCAEQAIRHLAAVGDPFDAFDVTELGVPEPDHPNRWGALFRAMSTAGVITACGFHESRRPTRSGGVCRVWIGTADRKEPAA